MSEIEEKKSTTRKEGEVFFDCNMCQEKFSSIVDMKAHICQNTTTFKCEKCPSEYVEETHLEQHTRTVHDALIILRHGRVGCHDCDQSFASKGALAKHQNTIHFGLKPFMCDICGYRATQKGALGQHVKTVHEKLKPWKCDTCGKDFKSKTCMVDHKNAIHLNFRPHVCEHCGYGCVKRAMLNAHYKKNHTKLWQEQQRLEKEKLYDLTDDGTFPFVCEHCGKGFKKQGVKQRHVNFIHLKVFPATCKVCGKNFSYPAKLRRHVEKEHNNKPTATVKTQSTVCDICTKVFQQPFSLRRHMRRFRGMCTWPKECRHPNDGMSESSKRGMMDRVAKVHMNNQRKLMARMQRKTQREAEYKGEKSFVCEHCGKSYTFKHGLKAHVNSVHFKLKPYVCEDCGDAFDRPSKHQDHCKRVHGKIRTRPAKTLVMDGKINNQRGTHKCAYCVHSYTRKAHLDEHMLVVHDHVVTFNGDGGRVECFTCEKSFGSMGALIQHQNTIHFKLKPYECTLCGRCFSQKQATEKHKRVVHKNGAKVRCDKCEETFPTRMMWQKHADKVHRDVTNHTCRHCDQGFYDWKEFRQHVDDQHRGISVHACSDCDMFFPGAADELDFHMAKEHKRYPCVKCDKVFVLKATQVFHTNVHHLGITKFTCPYCDKPWQRRHNLELHIRSVHYKSKPYPCDHCDASFSMKTHLNVHIERRHSDIVDNEMECPLCDKLFATKAVLNQHVCSEHFGILPYTCGHCNKGFRVSSEVRNHNTNLHFGKHESFKCNQCTRTFDDRVKLNSHLQRDHRSSDVYNCCECGDCFANTSDLDTHIIEAHTKGITILPNKVENGNRPSINDDVDNDNDDDNFNEIDDNYNDNGNGNGNDNDNYNDNVNDIDNDNGNDNLGVDSRTGLLEQVQSLLTQLFPNNRPRFACNLCKKRFRYQDLLQLHEEMEHVIQEQQVVDNSDEEEVEQVDNNTGSDEEKDMGGCDENEETNVDQEKVTEMNGEENMDGSNETVSNDKVVKVEKEEDHICSKCGRTFGNKNLLDGHIIDAHLEIKPYKCFGCDLFFEKKQSLKQHVEENRPLNKPYSFDQYLDCKEVRHLPQYGSPILSCQLCDHTFTALHNLQIHVVSFHYNLQLYACDECGQRFTTKEYLDRHYKRMHPTQGETCSKCGLVFDKKYLLDGHVIDAHLEIKPFECLGCGIFFAKKLSLKQHVLNNRPSGKPYLPDQLLDCQEVRQKTAEDAVLTCEQCRVIFTSMHVLQNHVVSIHHKLKPYGCGICGKAFSQKVHVDRHVKTVHPTQNDDNRTSEGNEEEKDENENENVNEKEDKDEKEDENENENEKENENENEKKNEQVGREEEQHICSKCGKMYGKKNLLDGHIVDAHLEINPFKCLGCGKFYAQKQLLEQHVKVNRPVDKPYLPNQHLDCKEERQKSHNTTIVTCEHCGQEFTSMFVLRNHVVSNHHKLKPYACGVCGKCFSQKADVDRHMKTVHPTQSDDNRTSEGNEEGDFHEDGNEQDEGNNDDLQKKDRPTREVMLDGKVSQTLGDHCCPFCPHSYSRKSHLDSHVLVIHRNDATAGDDGQPPVPVCFHCEIVCPSLDSLILHQHTVHFKLKPFQCADCGQCFNQNDNLEKHMEVVHDKSKPFKCDKCQKTFESKTKLEYHFQSAHVDIAYQLCEFCDQEFVGQNALEEHMEAQHKGESFPCDECEKSFTSRISLRKHKNMAHKSKEQRRYPCDKCDKVLMSSICLKDHVNLHHLGKARFTCPHCGKKENRRGNMKQHIKSVHMKFKGFKCDFCDKGFSMKTALALHIYRMHNENRQPRVLSHPCELCGKLFANLYVVRRHINTVHLGILPFECPTCGKGFPSPTSMKRHCLINHRTGPRKPQPQQQPQRPATRRKIQTFTCGQCGIGFSTETLLDQHLKSVHLKPPPPPPMPMPIQTSSSPRASSVKSSLRTSFKCGKCGVGFSTETLLDHHLKSVHLKPTTIPLRRTGCKLCGQMFGQVVELDQHMKASHQPRVDLQRCDDENVNKTMHQCKECPQKYSAKSQLDNHVAIVHRGLSKFPCCHCSKIFYLQSDWSKHYHTQHKYQAPVVKEEVVEDPLG